MYLYNYLDATAKKMHKEHTKNVTSAHIEHNIEHELNTNWTWIKHELDINGTWIESINAFCHRYSSTRHLYQNTGNKRIEESKTIVYLITISHR